MSPRSAIFPLWAVFCLSWGLAAFWSFRSVARPKISVELPHWGVSVLGGYLLLGARTPPGDGGRSRRGTPPASLAWLCVGLAALGLGFAGWARLSLGRLWSASVARKADHRIVEEGPYGLVRHPIYTGLIIACLATAAVRGTPIALAGALLVALGLRLKAGLEERFLERELGTLAYGDYRRRVPMLAPFAPWR